MKGELHTPILQALHAGGKAAGVSTLGAALIRDGTSALYDLPGGVVARIGPPGSGPVARHQLQVSHWLADAGIPVVRAVPGVAQPTMVGDRPVTWWVRLPDHRRATPAELGSVLRTLHSLPGTEQLGEIKPFESIPDRIAGANWLPGRDLAWLTDLLHRLRAEYAALPPGTPHRVIHGDAWQGNVAVVADRPVLLDLDHCSTGPPEWDLVPLAVDHTDFARISAEDYADFVAAYGGYDVTTWSGYRTLARIRELRWTTFVFDKSADEARHRIACLRGDVEPPWTWAAF